MAAWWHLYYNKWWRGGTEIIISRWLVARWHFNIIIAGGAGGTLIIIMLVARWHWWHFNYYNVGGVVAPVAPLLL